MSVLSQILAAKQQEIARLRPHASELRSQAEGAGEVRPFAAALRAGETVALIAEFKRRSPSVNWIRRDGMVAEIVKAYSDCGARAISVLTDENFFGGTMSDLSAARANSCVPLLRKDFVLEEVQLFESRAGGADAVLLIVAALDDAHLKDLLTIARGIGLDVLTETHNQREIERALKAGAAVIGVNNRDLATFSIDVDLSTRMLSLIPNEVIAVAESGVRSVDTMRQLGAAGFDAVLIGETLMRAADLRATIQTFASQPRRAR